MTVDVLVYPDMSSFRDLKNASGRDSNIDRGYLFFWVFHKLVITSFVKRISLTYPIFARALTVEKLSLVNRLLSVARCTDNYPPNTIILSLLVRYFAISNLATLHCPPPLVSLFTTVHDIGSIHVVMVQHAIHYHPTTINGRGAGILG